MLKEFLINRINKIKIFKTNQVNNNICKDKMFNKIIYQNNKVHIKMNNHKDLNIKLIVKQIINFSKTKKRFKIRKLIKKIKAN